MDDAQTLACALRRADWLPDGSNLAVASPGRRIEADASARDSGAAGVLTRLFELGQTLPAEDVRDALGEDGYAAATRLGLVAAEGAECACPGVLVRHGDLEDGIWVAGDRDQASGTHRLGRDHVSAVTAAACTLRHLVTRDRVDSFLDLGCGSGVQALWAAAQARHVVATDVADAALQLTARNARLNGVDVDIRAGSLWEPAAGEEFDVICSNAPFVISPPAEDGERLVYRDAGFFGDDFARALLEGVPAHLAPGGRAYVLLNWLLRPGDDPTERVREWLVGAGVDAWVVARDQMSAAEYAAHWVRDAGLAEGDAAWAERRRWYGWLRDLGVEAVAMGFVALRRPEGPRAGRVRGDVAYAGQPLPGPDAIDHVFVGLDALARLAGEGDGDALRRGLLTARPAPAAQLKESRVLQRGTGVPLSYTLVTDGPDTALGQLALDAPTIAVLGALDGDLTTDQACVAVASLMELDVDEVREGVLAALTEAIERGLYRLR